MQCNDAPSVVVAHHIVADVVGDTSTKVFAKVVDATHVTQKTQSNFADVVVGNLQHTSNRKPNRGETGNHDL